MLLVCALVFSGGVPGPLTARALAAAGEQAVWQFRFQGGDADIPEGVTVDSGGVYDQQNGLEFGWNHGMEDQTVTRNTYSGPDSFIRTRGGDQWELSLARGKYEVSVTVGDAVYSSVNTVYAENLALAEQMALAEGAVHSVKQSIYVYDGRLTLTFGDQPASATALRAVQVLKLDEPEKRKPAAPQISLPPEARTSSGNKLLLSGQSTNIYNTPEYIRVAGLDAAIGGHLESKWQEMEDQLSSLQAQAVFGGHDVPAIQSAIAGSAGVPVVIRSGQLNLDSSAVFGSPERPVFLIVDGINTNQKLSVTVYGSLFVRQNLNANTELTLKMLPSNLQLEKEGNIWVGGSLHLNQNSTVQASGQLAAGSLVYNNGTLQVSANTILVKGNLNINTRVDMSAQEEITVGELVSNNETANLVVTRGDFFIKNNVSVNNHLRIAAGGWIAMGGNLTANKQPVIQSGYGGHGHTLLKYALHGLRAEYYSGSDFAGTMLNKVDEQINVQTRPVLPASGFNDQDFSVRWSGQFQPEYSEEYTLDMQSRGPVRLWLNDQLVIDRWESGSGGPQTVTAQVYAGERYNVRAEYSSKDGNPQAVLYWQSASQAHEPIPQENLYPFGIPQPSAIAASDALTLQWPSVWQADGHEVEVDGVIYPVGSTPSYRYAGLEPGTVHTYRVRANSGDIIGEWSQLKEAWTLPDVPGNVRLDSTIDSVQLTWDAVEGAIGYEVETYNTVLNVGSALSYTDQHLESNMQRTYRVRAYNASGPGAWSRLFVGITLPAVPANLKGTPSDTAIVLTWDTVPGALSYDLEIDGSLTSGIKAVRHVYAPADPGSVHSFRARSVNQDGTSPWSGQVEVYVQPSVPQHVQAIAGSSSIRFEWERTPGAKTYEIEIDGRITDNGEANFYSMSPVDSSSEHTYRVRAKSAYTAGEWSVLSRVMTLPDTPVQVQAVAVSSSVIALGWNAVKGAQGYEVEADGEVIPVSLQGTYRHEQLLPNSTHSYRVRAWNAGGVGAWSERITKTTGLGQPQQVAVMSNENAITLSWEPVEGAETYDVLADGVLIDNGASNRFEHSGLEPNSRHVYRVRARSGSTVGDWSETVSSLTALGTPRIINVVSGSQHIDISWSQVEGAAGYELEADGVILAVGQATAYSHTNLSSNSLHTYRVRAVNGTVVGEWSNWSSLATSSTAPSMPINLKAEASATAIVLSWDKVMGANGYEVEVDGQTVPVHSGNSYTHGGLEPNTMHTYRVRSTGSEGSSDWTSKLKKNTLPELTVDIPQDTQFNFVFAVPRKAGQLQRKITVTYDPDKLEILDLSSITPEYERTAGAIQGTNMVVASYTPGTIVYIVYDADKTIVNSIRLQTKTNEYSKLRYVIE